MPLINKIAIGHTNPNKNVKKPPLNKKQGWIQVWNVAVLKCKHTHAFITLMRKNIKYV